MTIAIQLVLVGLVAGVAGGMFGIGGGAIMVPAMVLLLNLDQKFATGTSLAAQLLPVALIGVKVYYDNGNLNFKYAGFIALGLLVGFGVGALFANQPHVSSEAIKKMYGVFLLGVGLRYLLFK